MVDRSLRMDMRLLRGALWRRRSTAGLAVLAVTIGASVASALLHVSGDVSRKLTRELRTLGPNLLVVPRTFHEPLATEGSSVRAATSRFLDAAAAHQRLTSAGVAGAAILYVAGRVGETPIQIIGADLSAVRALHPSWKLDANAPAGPEPSWLGIRLARRLDVHAGQSVRLASLDGARSIDIVAGSTLDAGGADDEAWWIPIESAQRLGGLGNVASVVQARVDGNGGEAETIARVIEEGGDFDAIPLHALTATEGRLLDRTRRLMMLVTIAALVAAGLCAFGSLTDLALERRREIALMKALGATRRGILRQFAAESLAIGVLGGVSGWLLGLAMAQVIGREVFHSAIALRADVPFVVLGLSLVVAGIASLGPLRLALAVEPALALKGD